MIDDCEKLVFGALLMKSKVVDCFSAAFSCFCPFFSRGLVAGLGWSSLYAGVFTDRVTRKRRAAAALSCPVPVR